MKISDNTLIALRQYFNTQLTDFYSKSEIDIFFFLIAEHFFGFSKSNFLLNSEIRLSESDLLIGIKSVKRLKNHEPIQYIVGETNFFGLPFLVNENVLIPRPETEELVDWVLKENSNKNMSIIDIGTGSGCIPITLKKNRRDWLISAIDVSENALEMAIKNSKQNNVVIDFIKGDILNLENIPLQLFKTKFDIIISNPPYVLESDKNEMEKNVLNYEPHIALFVENNDPLLFYRAIINFAKNSLKTNGKLYFEIHQHQQQNFENLFKEFEIGNFEFKNDINNNQRMLKIQF